MFSLAENSTSITRHELPSLNSITKYPSIPTYHKLGERGMLLDEVDVAFQDDEQVIVTEKVDGTNARVIIMPDGNYFIGSREELLHTRDDLIFIPTERIVETLLPLESFQSSPDFVMVYYVEVFGAKIGKRGKVYAGGTNSTDWRLFDIMELPVALFDELITEKPEVVARWREQGNQPFISWWKMHQYFPALNSPIVPSWYARACDLPKTLEECCEFLRRFVERTSCSFSQFECLPFEKVRGEGVVLRTANRTKIAKLRFEDYERTLNRKG